MYYCKRTLPSESGLDGHFANYKTIDGLPNEQAVLQLLRRCAYIVAPIMRRHDWVIPTLTELPSDSPNLGSMSAAHLTYYTTGRPWKRSNSNVAFLNIDLQVRHHEQPHMCNRMEVLVQTLLHQLAHINSEHNGLHHLWATSKLLRELERDVMVGDMKALRREIPDQVVQRGEVGCVSQLFSSLALRMLRCFS
jgi:hypothetical protein